MSLAALDSHVASRPRSCNAALGWSPDGFWEARIEPGRARPERQAAQARFKLRPSATTNTPSESAMAMCERP